MSTIHRCPENVLRLFDEGNPQKGMQEAITWLLSIRPIKGDMILMPYSDAGELKPYAYNPENDTRKTDN